MSNISRIEVIKAGIISGMTQKEQIAKLSKGKDVG
jgi:hypothetical protein